MVILIFNTHTQHTFPEDPMGKTWSKLLPLTARSCLEYLLAFRGGVGRWVMARGSGEGGEALDVVGGGEDGP